MPRKDVTQLVREVLDQPQLDRLVQLFGAPAADTDAVLEAIVAAAFAEYSSAILAAAPITRADELQQQRLLQLMQRGAFRNLLPSEQQVARIFHLTPTRARTFLRNVLARFSTELAGSLDATLAAELGKARRPDKTAIYLFTSNEVVIEGLQRKLDDFNASGAKPYMLKRISRDPDVKGRWTIPPDSYDELCAELHVPVQPPP